MLGYEAIADLVVSWALRRGESVGVKRNDGMDDRLAVAMDRLGRLVWGRLQQDSAWRRWEPEMSRAGSGPLTKHRVEAAIEAAADRDRTFWYELQAAAGEVQTLVRDNPGSARAVGISLPASPAVAARRRREGSVRGYVTVGALALVVLVGFVIAVRAPQHDHASTVADGVSGSSRAEQRSRVSSSGTSTGTGDVTRYELRSAAPVGASDRKAPPGLTFVESSIEVSNPGARSVTLEPLSLAVPMALVALGADGSCRLGRASGRASGGDCLLPTTGSRSTLGPGETRRLTYSSADPLPADVDLSRLELVRR
jgi:hypothetical protein